MIVLIFLILVLLCNKWDEKLAAALFWLFMLLLLASGQPIHAILFYLIVKDTAIHT
jgi:hypothetical protein